ncbi:MAG: MarR family transcriptional regulator [Gammaproteobacteria bacterium]|nr:MarR family transcriptional regulator [Gammaproteobacteria bacterium]
MGSRLSSKTAARQDFMPLMRALVRAYQGFAAFDADGHRIAGLTVPQADVIFALGIAGSMTFRDIGEHTLISKGTLTGVVDRLEGKRLVRRVTSKADQRCTQVMLTDGGECLFEQHFPRQVDYLKQRFDRLSRTEKAEATRLLEKLAAAFW